MTQNHHPRPRTDAPSPLHPLDNPARSSLTGPHARFRRGAGEFCAIPPTSLPGSRSPTSRTPRTGPMSRRSPDRAGPSPWPRSRTRRRRTGRSSSGPRASSWSTRRWTPRPILRRSRWAPGTCRRCWTWWRAPVPAPSCRARSSWARTWASVGAARWWRWRGSGCTRPAGPRSAASARTSPYGGRGGPSRWFLAVAHGIRERGETPFLHASASNTGAVRLYESLGFRLRRRTEFLSALVPATLPSAEGTPGPRCADRSPSAYLPGAVPPPRQPASGGPAPVRAPVSDGTRTAPGRHPDGTRSGTRTAGPGPEAPPVRDLGPGRKSRAGPSAVSGPQALRGMRPPPGPLERTDRNCGRHRETSGRTGRAHEVAGHGTEADGVRHRGAVPRPVRTRAPRRCPEAGSATGHWSAVSRC